MLVMRIRTSYLTAWGLSFPFCKMGTRTGTQMFIIAYVMVSPHVQPHPGLQWELSVLVSLSPGEK